MAPVVKRTDKKRKAVRSTAATQKKLQESISKACDSCGGKSSQSRKSKSQIMALLRKIMAYLLGESCSAKKMKKKCKCKSKKKKSTCKPKKKRCTPKKKKC